MNFIMFIKSSMGQLVLIWDELLILVDMWCNFIIIYIFMINYELIISNQFLLLQKYS